MINFPRLNLFKRATPARPTNHDTSANLARIIYLANSRKRSGRCVAGKTLNSGEHRWIRPVSARPDQEISRNELTLTDGTEPRLLDILDIPTQVHQPRLHQQENWLLAPRARWTKVGRAAWDDLPALLDAPEVLWTIGSHTHQGWHDRVSVAECRKLSSSLCFIRVENLTLRILMPGAEYGRQDRRVQGQFRYNDVYYRMWLTDPRVENVYARKPDGEYQIGECFITINLTEPLLGFCHKLVASVITLQTCGGPL